jgi:hypothetical protein
LEAGQRAEDRHAAKAVGYRPSSLMFTYDLIIHALYFARELWEKLPSDWQFLLGK